MEKTVLALAALEAALIVWLVGLLFVLGPFQTQPGYALSIFPRYALVAACFLICPLLSILGALKDSRDPQGGGLSCALLVLLGFNLLGFGGFLMFTTGGV